MSKRTAPYRHQDGSNCWTKNCRLGHQKSPEEQKEEFIKKMVETHKAEEQSSPTYIDSIAPAEAFAKAVENREISRSRHPDYPYSIYKYSQSTTYEKNWNDITLASRGLIVNDETGEILARPFPKFFNYSEHNTPEYLMTGKVVVAEKLDGSLGILYPTPDGLKISTAGGFQSAQADHATAIYQERYDGKWKPRKNVTYLYEIIYPSNKIVVDYADEDDIHLLGAVSIKTGKSIPLSELKEWKWKRAKEFPEMTSLEDAVAAPNRSNHEGYIVHFTETDTRVKLKHEEYLTLHRFATNVSKRTVWEMMKNGENLDQWKTKAPEEFWDYIDTAQSSVRKEFNTIHAKIDDYTAKAQSAKQDDWSQKDIAQWVNSNVPGDYRGFVFTKLQGRPIEGRSLATIWERIKPPAEKGFWLAGNGE